MAQLNWSKAAKQFRVAKSGAEQVTEFGDVIDKARRAAITENRKLASGAAGRTPKRKKKKKKPAKMARPESNRPVTQAVSGASPKPRNHIREARRVASETGFLTAYEMAIDTYIQEAEVLSFKGIPLPMRRLIEKILSVRFLQRSGGLEKPKQ